MPYLPTHWKREGGEGGGFSVNGNRVEIWSSLKGYATYWTDQKVELKETNGRGGTPANVLKSL